MYTVTQKNDSLHIKGNREEHEEVRTSIALLEGFITESVRTTAPPKNGQVIEVMYRFADAAKASLAKTELMNKGAI